MGQCEISHPMISVESSSGPDQEDESLPLDGLGEFSSPRQNVMFEAVTKGTHEPLPSRINRELYCPASFVPAPLKRGFRTGLYYINAYGMEVRPSPNGDFLANLDTRDILVYSCGSLWTRFITLL